MKSAIVSILGLGALAGGVAVHPAAAREHICTRQFRLDNAECKAEARRVSEAATAPRHIGLQDEFDEIYGDCIVFKGYGLDYVRDCSPAYGPHYDGPYQFWRPGAFFGRGHSWWER